METGFSIASRLIEKGDLVIDSPVLERAGGFAIAAVAIGVAAFLWKCKTEVKVDAKVDVKVDSNDMAVIAGEFFQKS